MNGFKNLLKTKQNTFSDENSTKIYNDLLVELNMSTNPIKLWVNYLSSYSIVLFTKSIYDVL